MMASDKQLNCIEIIRDKVNFSDDCIKSEKQKELRDKCLSDYMELYPKIKGKTLTKLEASCFISKWIDFSKQFAVKVSGYGIGRNEGWDSENCDIFPTDMYY